jgi:nucleoside-diphosphate-sugar epimerase
MSEFGRVLITGAGGFVGGRIAEVLHCAELAEVRAGVRRWASAARIGRFPFEIALCDVTDPAQLRAAVAGVRAIVHCARTDNLQAAPALRHVLESAIDVGARRVVHFSSAAVYGDVEGDVDDTAPVRPTGHAYGDAKLEAEALCADFAQRGLDIVVLRPTLIYGPYGDEWTGDYARRMARGLWMIPPEYCGGTANLVYVDDVVQAVIRALRTEHGRGNACAYIINGAERVTWWQYFTALNDALGLPPLVAQSAVRSQVAARVMQPVRGGAKLALRHFPRAIRLLAQRSNMAKILMKQAESAIRQTPTLQEFNFYQRKAFFSSAKAQRLLGYAPAFSMADGVGLSAAWLQHNHYVPQRPPTA